ncbi:putative CALMODULIN-BINDING PROTEIN60 [Medicago truncatula]|nr:calmodulin-binding protein [Medicago truncatula]RHN49174.1 putative CALMODULIN-BINDING PROTEIN60 [Medicago truncatula]
MSNTFGRRRLQFCFMNKLPNRIFTKSTIKAEGDEPLQIELRDVENQQRVVMEEGSSMKIQLCVLYGDFEKEDWTAEEFNTQIAPPREGKEELLKGNEFITLRNGVADIDKEIEFTDISKGRNGQFRLGVKIVQSNSIGVCIREGRSEPFKVLDVRGKNYEKHDRPSLNDEVWRLKGIRKNGPLDKLLASDGIHTVKDFLRLYITNEASLREKIGKIARNSWNTIVAHAKDCDVDNDDERYIYYSTEQPISFLVFNAIYKVVEVTFHNEQNARSIQSLNQQEKRLVERVKQHAYKYFNDWNPLPIDTTTLGLEETLTGVQNAQYDGQDQALQQSDFLVCQQGQKEIGQSYVQPCISTSYVNEGMDNYQIYVDPMPDIREIPQNNHVEGEMYIDGDGYGSHFPVVEGRYSMENLMNDYPIYTTCEPENYNLYGFSDVAECSTHVNFLDSSMDISSSDKSKAVWCKVGIAIKWVISIRRVAAAAKRNANLFYFN